MEIITQLKNKCFKKFVNALKSQDFASAKWVVENGRIDPNAWCGDLGVSPLHLSIGYGDEEFATNVTHYLLRQGGNPNVVDLDGVTPVHVAAAWNRACVLHILLVHGGDPWLKDNESMDAFSHAFQEQARVSLELLQRFRVCRKGPRHRCCSPTDSSVDLTATKQYRDFNSVDNGETSKYNDIKQWINTANYYSDHSHNLCINAAFSDNTSLSGQSDSNQSCGNQVSNNYYNCGINDPRSEKAWALAYSEKQSNDKDSYYSTRSEVYSSLPDNESVRSGVSTKTYVVRNSKSKVMKYIIPVIESIDSPIVKNEVIIEIHNPPLGSDTECEQMFEKIEHCKLKCDAEVLKASPDIKPEIKTEISNTPLRSSYLNISTPIFKTDLQNSPTSSPPCLTESPVDNKESTIVKAMADLKISGKKKNVSPVVENSRDKLFAELALAVKRRSIRMSGVEPLPSGDDTFLSAKSNVHESGDEPYEHPLEVKTVGSADTNNSVFTSEMCLPCSLPKNGGIPTKDAVGKIPTEVIQVQTSNNLVNDNMGKDLIKCSGTEVIDKPVTLANYVTNVIVQQEDSSEGVKDNIIESINIIKGSKEIDTNFPRDVKSNSERSSGSSYASCSEETNCCQSSEDDRLRQMLIDYGFSPGPITASTRRIYLQKLRKLRGQKISPSVAPRKTPVTVCSVKARRRSRSTPPGARSAPTPFSRFKKGRAPKVSFTNQIYSQSSKLHQYRVGVYSPELEDVIAEPFVNIPYSYLENRMTDTLFQSSLRLRHCQVKTSFNYLLLDSRKTTNMAMDSNSPEDITRKFLSAVFYVGKGKASRPYSHLQTAASIWRNRGQPSDPKQSQIMDIWQSGHGVICHMIFHSIADAEALTREAAMMEAMCLRNLTNRRRGEYEYTVNRWPESDRRKLGVCLLFKARNSFLLNSARPLRPDDI